MIMLKVIVMIAKGGSSSIEMKQPVNPNSSDIITIRLFEDAILFQNQMNLRILCWNIYDRIVVRNARTQPRVKLNIPQLIKFEIIFDVVYPPIITKYKMAN